jgi:hypothetical protein
VGITTDTRASPFCRSGEGAALAAWLADPPWGPSLAPLPAHSEKLLYYLNTILNLDRVLAGGQGAAQGRRVMVRTELYFGRDIPGKGEVSDIAFAKFLSEFMSRELPEGLTLFDAYGQYEDKNGAILKEATKVMIIFHEDSVTESSSIDRVIAEYRRRFGGAKVMRSSSPAEVQFYVD